MNRERRTFAARDEAERAAAALAAELGHDLAATWHRLSGRMFATICFRCGALVFVERPAGIRGELWYVEGAAVEESCPGRE